MKLRFGRVVFPILFLLVFLSSFLSQVASQETSTPSSLSLTVYSDGVAHVTYVLDVNQSLPSVNVTLFGSQYENIIVIDENGTFLDYTLNEPTISIDSLGARSVRIEWDALDLTNKTLGIWTLTIDTPINFTITFPTNTTIIDLSETPLEIKSENQQPILTMPEGLQTISYVVGTITPQEDAREILDAVAMIIANIKAEGVNTAEAEALLQQAENAFTNGNYTGAEKLANDALELAYALEAEAKSFPTHLLLPIASLAIAVVIGVFLVRKVKERKIDVEEIFQGYPWLRDDQKEVVRFLAEKREGVFEAELRKAFDFPKSSMWRLIKKLEEEDILVVSQIRGQNYIELKKRKR